jgi:hypothetical protein
MFHWLKRKPPEPLIFHETMAQKTGEGPIDIPDAEEQSELENRMDAVLTGEVDHPSYYNRGQIEVIDAIEDWQLGFHLGSAVKYIARAGHKDPRTIITDLRKAVWYINRKIDQLEGRV